MKLTTKKEIVRNIEIIVYSIDGIQIAQAKKYSDWFCTIDKRGVPSNIRDKVKKCRSFEWNRNGLMKVTNNPNITVGSKRSFSLSNKTVDFADSYPDTSWGDTGTIPSKKEILELVGKVVIPFKVNIIESERGWGSKIDSVHTFDSREKAEDYIKKFNSSNTATTVPDWYMRAEAANF